MNKNNKKIHSISLGFFCFVTFSQYLYFLTYLSFSRSLSSPRTDINRRKRDEKKFSYTFDYCCYWCCSNCFFFRLHDYPPYSRAAAATKKMFEMIEKGKLGNECQIYKSSYWISHSLSSLCMWKIHFKQMNLTTIARKHPPHIRIVFRAEFYHFYINRNDRDDENAEENCERLCLMMRELTMIQWKLINITIGLEMAIKIEYLSWYKRKEDAFYPQIFSPFYCMNMIYFLMCNPPPHAVIKPASMRVSGIYALSRRLTHKNEFFKPMQSRIQPKIISTLRSSTLI